MKPIDTSKPVRFVDPDKRDWVAEFLSNLGGCLPLLFRYRVPDSDVWVTTRTDLRGRLGSGRFIENVPVRHGRWLNCYHDGTGWVERAHATRDDADQYAGPDRIACVYVEFDEGDGL